MQKPLSLFVPKVMQAHTEHVLQFSYSKIFIKCRDTFFVLPATGLKYESPEKHLEDISFP